MACFLVKQRWSRVGVSAAGSAVAAGDLRGHRTVPGATAAAAWHGLCGFTQEKPLPSPAPGKTWGKIFPDPK